jgi:zinc and cadmium transporter
MGALTLWSTGRLQAFVAILISLAVGALFGDALVHLIPEAFAEGSSVPTTAAYVLMGILIFYALEAFLHWHHEHRSQAAEPVHPMAYVNLLADGLHNFVDGLVIGASFLAGPPIGIATTIAVALHEIPQELGDFGILVRSGFTRRRALTMNFVTALLAVLGAVISLLIAGEIEGYTPVMLGITAGGFIYLAGADLIPELHKEHNLPGSLVQFLAVIVGMGLMFLLLLI